MNFVQREARAPAYVDENPVRSMDGVVLKERTGDGSIGRIHSAVRAGGHGRAHDGVALPLHDCFHVSEVAVDDSRHGDDVRDALHSLAKNVVRDAERVEEAGTALDSFHQSLVGDDDNRVHGADEFGEPLLRLHHAAFAFEGKGLGHDSDRERAEFRSERSHHGRCARAGAAAKARRDEDHIRAFQRLDDLVRILERGFAADFWVGASAEALGEFGSELKFYGRL